MKIQFFLRRRQINNNILLPATFSFRFFFCFQLSNYLLDMTHFACKHEERGKKMAPAFKNSCNQMLQKQVTMTTTIIMTQSLNYKMPTDAHTDRQIENEKDVN